MSLGKRFGRRSFLARLSALAGSSFAASFSKLEKVFALSGAHNRRPRTMVATLFGWGNNYSSILSVSSAAQFASSPCQANTKKWVKVVADYNYSFGITQDGFLWYWGNDGAHYVHGNGSLNLFSSPVRLGTATWQDIALNDSAVLAVKTDGTLWGWGRNYTDQFPINVSSDAVSLPLIAAGAGASWTSISANYGPGGGTNTVGIRSNGYGYVFGANDTYQLGLGDNTKRSAVVQVGPGFASASVGKRHTMYITTGGALQGTGHQLSGALGNGVITDTYVSTPITIGSITNWSSVAAGNDCTVLIRTGGTLWFMGAGSDGTSGRIGINNVSSPMQVGTLTTWSKISLFDRHVLAVQTDGSLWAWGKNSVGQLGNGNASNQSSPVRVGALTTWTNAWAGAQTSLALKSDGSLWAWGDNSNGALGIGSTTSQSSPVRVGVSTWSKAATSIYMSAGVRSDGTLWAWGFLTSFTGFGQVSTPVQIGTATDWIDVKTGYHYIVAVKSDFSLYNLGTNFYGQLGSSVETWYSTPVQMGSATNWKKVSMKDFAGVAAIKTDGTLWNWGWQFPAGDQSWAGYRLKTPVQVGTGTNWVDVEACAGNMMAIKSDGTLWGWGSQRNKGGFAAFNGDTSTPIQVGTATNWSKFSMGNGVTAAIKTDGTLWTWGDSNFGELGLGAGSVNVQTPVQVGTLTTWTDVQIRNLHIHGIQSDRSLWGWGMNNCAQLGDTTTNNASTPVMLSTAKNWIKVFSGSQSTFGIRKL